MRYKFLLLIITLLALKVGPLKLSANECSGDAITCTPVQLCRGATETVNGEIFWSTSAKFNRYVETAKKLGIDCGVIEPIKTCKSDVEMCTISQLCKEATYLKQGKIAWYEGKVYQKHVHLAQSFGLNCNVDYANISVITKTKVWLRIKDKNDKIFVQKITKKGEEILLPQDEGPYRMRAAMAGSVYFKVANQIYGPVGTGTNQVYNFLISPSFIKRNLAIRFPKLAPPNSKTTNLKSNEFSPNHATKPKSRPISLKELTNRPKSRPKDEQEIAENCKENPTICDDKQLCSLATFTNSSAKFLKWKTGLSAKYADFAKARGLSCGVKSSAVSKKADEKLSIVALVQRELNRIGCDVGKVDGKIGPKTRKGLMAFTVQTEFLYNPKLLKDHKFLKSIKGYPNETCPQKPVKSKQPLSTPQKQKILINRNNAELEKLIRERNLLQDNLRASQELIEQQRIAAARPYKACLANCLLNNKAGKGFSAALSGISQCNSSCAPLKWGGAVVPPSWERDRIKLKRYNCMITKLSNNQAAVDCNEF